MIPSICANGTMPARNLLKTNIHMLNYNLKIYCASKYTSGIAFEALVHTSYRSYTQQTVSISVSIITLKVALECLVAHCASVSFCSVLWH